ncbi:MAG: type II toxin-antitoxin system VapC family toxin [Mangrovibacterium sp.]
MNLIDSNIIIYSYSENYQYLREIIVGEGAYVSEISRVEVLGYHNLSPEEEIYFQDVFTLLPSILPTPNIFNKAIELRRAYNMKLADSIIAATALEHQMNIYTRNLSDFEKTDGLKCINPVR